MRVKKRHIIVWVLLVVIAAGLLWWGRYSISHGIATSSKSERVLHVMTYNTCRMGGFAKPEENKVIQYILAQDADVVCLQEVEVYQDNEYLTLGELSDKMSSYPYRYFAFSVHNNRRQFGNAVFSKFPILDRENVHYVSRSNSTCRCDIAAYGDTIRLFCNHLESYRINIDSLQDSTAIGSVRRFRSMLPFLQGKDKGRLEQAQAVREEIEQSPYPVLVVGDFNDLPWSATYRTIAQGLTDAFLATSVGRLGASFRLPVKVAGQKMVVPLRIDYVLCAPTLVPVKCWTDSVSYSDHLPVHAIIEL